jgi:thioredoxin 1
MSEADDIERIRERKRERLQSTTGAADDGDASPETASGAPGEPIHVEGADHLDRLVAEHDVVLADFYADWCGPCKMLEPVVASLAAETPAAVAKVDVDSQQALAGQYRVSGVPTLVLFADGEAVEQLVGARDEATLRSLIERYA